MVAKKNQTAKDRFLKKAETSLLVYGFDPTPSMTNSQISFEVNGISDTSRMASTEL